MTNDTTSIFISSNSFGWRSTLYRNLGRFVKKSRVVKLSSPALGLNGLQISILDNPKDAIAYNATLYLLADKSENVGKAFSDEGILEIINNKIKEYVDVTKKIAEHVNDINVFDSSDYSGAIDFVANYLEFDKKYRAISKEEALIKTDPSFLFGLESSPEYNKVMSMLTDSLLEEANAIYQSAKK